MLFRFDEMKYTQIIWDFNGTILNDVQTGIDAVNVLLDRYKKPRIASVEQYRRAFGFPVINYYDSIGLERENFARYAPEWVHEYNLREPDATLFEGIADALAYFKRRKVPQYLLSATELQMLEKQVARLGIRAYFAELIGQDGIEAHGKIGTAERFARRVDLVRPLFIGDSLHDYEVAQAIGAECVLLAWGHQDRARLEKTGCRVYDTIKDLLTDLENGETA